MHEYYTTTYCPVMAQTTTRVCYHSMLQYNILEFIIPKALKLPRQISTPLIRKSHLAPGNVLQHPLVTTERAPWLTIYDY